MSEISKQNSGTLATLGLGGIAPAKYADDKAFNAVASGGKWLPRLQLFGGNSDAAKEGKIQMGSYGLVTSKDQLTPLGTEVDVLVLSWRPKAMSVGGEDIITEYNPQSANFKALVAKADEPDSGCMYGPEFLLWIPTVRKYATFMMGSKSSRREAPNLRAILDGQKDGKIPAATLKVTLIAGKKYKWHNPVVTVCSTPFDLPEDNDEMISVANDFNNPPESDTEMVTPEEKASAGRAR